MPDAGFCISRVVTSIVRIASVCLPRNVSLGIAAQIFLAAGVLILYIINLIFAMRLVRSTHPRLGWHPAFSIIFKALFVLVGLTIIAVIAATIQSFYTLDMNTKATDRGFQLYGSTFLAIIATLPLPITVLSFTIPYSPPDRFGMGRLRTKVIVLLISTIFLALGAWYRCGVAFQPPTPRNQPLPGYLAKPPFYIMNFVMEIQTVFMYAILRVDLRFHIPNGARGAGSYSNAPRPSVNDDEQEILDTQSTTTDEQSDAEKPHPAVYPPPLPIDLEAIKSHRTSILSSRHASLSTKSGSSTLASSATQQNKKWRESEEARIIRRLGGPWQSPTESSFSKYSSPTKSTFSYDVGDDALPHPPPLLMHRNSGEAPSIPDVVGEMNQGGWTPRIEWEFKSPRRFLSLKKRSMIGLTLEGVGK
jgi:hypothetical protein